MRKGLCLTWLFASTTTLGQPPLRALNPHAARDAFFVKEFSLWSGIFNTAYSDNISVERDSSPLRDYQIKLTDGVVGNSADLPGSFALFDGPKAHIKYSLPAWFDLHSLSFQALEVDGEPLPRVRLRYISQKNTRELALQREVLHGQGGVRIARYSVATKFLPLTGGVLDLNYDNSPSTYVFIDELVFNGLGLGRPANAEDFPRKLSSWKERYGKAEFVRIKRFVGETKSDTQRLRLLLGHPEETHPTRLVHLAKVADPHGRFNIFNFILQVDRSGLYILDAVRGVLVLPNKHGASVPLVVLNHQGTVYGSDEPVGFMGRKELAFAQELAENGIASLSVDSIVNNGLLDATSYHSYLYHPHWSGLGKDFDNVRRSLDFALSEKFQQQAGLRLDSRRLAAFGFSYGGLLSLVSGLYDPRYSFVGISHLEDYSQDWKNFASNLYIPQLAYFPEGKIPLHVCRLVKELGTKAHVSVVLGEVALAKHYRECLDASDKRVEVKVNASGKTLTMGERDYFLQKIFSQFDVKAKTKIFAPLFPLDSDLDGALRRENAWREIFMRNMKQ